MVNKKYDLEEKGEFRLDSSFKERAEAIVREKYPKYSSVAHFYRAAVVKLVREEETSK